MCGIVGLWNFSRQPVSPFMLRRFTDTLAHRGPDGSDIFIDEEAGLGLGHRRLAIIDTSDGGRQPMSLEGRYWAVFNGEIYNFVELRKELEGYGHRFKTDSDTEVILASYDQWGEECQLRFNGMWALAIWDARDRKLFLSRDRFGVKPLLYHYDGRRFAFASEMKAFLALDRFRLEFDVPVVAAALSDPTLVEGMETTLLQGVKRLPGGHSLVLAQTGSLMIRRWWHTLEHLETVPRRYADQTARYRELFLDACRIRMRSDVPIGTALSGGLDSSSVLCGMSQIRNSGDQTDRMAADWQRAFIGSYPGKAIDERVYADQVIERTGARPIYCEMNAGMYLENFHEILFQYEELSDIHLGPWYVHKKQREQGVVVTIDGHGGDEALGGYTWHVSAAMQDALTNPLRLIQLASILNGMGVTVDAQSLPRVLKRLGGHAFRRSGGNSKGSWLAATPARFHSSVMEADLPSLKARDSLFKQLYIDFHFTHLPTNLRDFDRLSMAHGVEVRAPFMDWRLVCFTFSLPSDRKIGGGYTKKILRDAMQGILPEGIRRRTRKLGFPNLAEGWTSTRAREFILDAIGCSDFIESPIWNGRQIAAEMEPALRTADAGRIHRAWRFVQALYLMRAFHSKQQDYQVEKV